MPDCNCDCNDRIDRIIENTLTVAICLAVLLLALCGAYVIGSDVGYDKAFKLYLKGK